MRKPVLLAAFTLCLYAADFWQSKPFTEWSDKDVRRMLDNSPWAKLCIVATAGQSGSAKGRAPSLNAGGSSNTPSDMPASSRRGGTPDVGGSVPTVNLTVRWESAMPVRQAMVKLKFASEAGTSAEAKMALESPSEYYVLSVAGVPRSDLPGDTEELKKQMVSQARLLIKGKDPIKAVDFMTRAAGMNSEGLFAFPKDPPIVEQDKEIEFVARIGELSVRQRFRLKDMLVNGKLDL